jgi:fibronectin-binding autotransporter adhesin
VNSGTISGGTNGDGSGIALGASFSGNSDALVNLGSGVINGGVSITGSNNSVTLFTGSVINGALNMGADTQSLLTLDGAGTSVFSSAVTGTTTLAGQLTKQGAGIWTIDRTLNASSVTISAGTLQVGNGGTTGSLGSGAVSNNASLIMNRSDAVNLSNVISGTGGFTQAGAGTTTLTASNSFSGTTTINAGTLLANNTAGSALGSSTVTVQSGGTLGGNGSIAGPVTIASGGNLTPGSGGAGALSLRNGLTLQSGATTTFLINSAASFTSINILGNSIAYGGDLEFNIVNYTPADGNIFTLFNMTGGATTSGAFSNVRAGGLNFVGNNGVWKASSTSHSYEFSQSTGQLSVTAGVPEPSTYVLLAICALVMAVVWGRRNARA